MNRALTVCIALAASLASALASAEFHLFQIEQVYSNASGSIQFVVLHEFAGANDEHLLSGRSLVSNGPGGTRTLVFPNNLPSRLTAGRHALIATQGFADLGLVAPDYIIPEGFVPLTAGTLNYAGVDAVSYASLPTDGTMALTRTGSLATNLATNFAGQSATVNPSAPPPPPPPAAASNFQGMWVAVPAEVGWGINFTHQGNAIFASWFTYDTSGRPWWLTMTALQQPDGSFAGDIDQTRGPPFSASPFLGPIQHDFIGSGRLTFTDANNGTFAYIVNGFSQTKALTRFVFASPVPTCTFNSPMPMSQALNYQGMWAAAGEGGWGINFTHQGDVIFASWFTYDAAGNPWWLTATLPRVGGTTGPYGEPMAGRTYIGSLDATTGPPFNSVPFDSSRVTHDTSVGIASLTFAHGASVTFDYTVNGVRQIKVLEPFVFRAPGTVCQ